LRALCERVSPGHVPIHIDIAPLPGCQIDDCYPNVSDKVDTEGGSSVFGWAIYEWPRIWHEFQFHAVWRDPNGILRDVTPRADREKVVLFLPSDLSYTGEAVSTRRFSCSETPKVRRILSIQKEIDDLKVAYFVAKGESSIMDPVSAAPVLRLEQEKAFLVASLGITIERNDLCPCMSRKKFKHCCGQ
jgi:hypothetical protein